MTELSALALASTTYHVGICWDSMLALVELMFMISNLGLKVTNIKILIKSYTNLTKIDS